MGGVLSTIWHQQYKAVIDFLQNYQPFGHTSVPSAIQVGTGNTALSSKLTNTKQLSVSSKLHRPIPKVARVTFWSLNMLYLFNGGAKQQ